MAPRTSLLLAACARSAFAAPLADFARAALAARDNYRVKAYFDRGERFPKDTHFDDLDWDAGFTEVWLYALRNARVALATNASDVRDLHAVEQQLLRTSVRGRRKAWRAVRAKLGDDRIDSLLQSISNADGIDVSAPADRETLWGRIGVTWPSVSVEVSDARSSILLSNGVAMPRLGLGTTMVEGEDGKDVMIRAIRYHPYRLIDTAQAYGNEAQVGLAVELAGVPRRDIFIATKLSDPRDQRSKGRVRKLIQRQLELLRTDYIDLYFLHGPDEDFPKYSVLAWRVLEEFYRAGKLRALGVSNFNEEQLIAFRKLADVPPHVVQNKFSIYHHGDAPMPEQSFLGATQTSSDLGAPLGFMGYCNLDVYPAVLEPLQDPHVARIAAKVNRTPAQVLLRHALQMGTSVIPKTSGKHGRLAENSALFDFKLDDSEMRHLNMLAQFAARTQLQHVEDGYGVHKETITARAEL